MYTMYNSRLFKKLNKIVLFTRLTNQIFCIW